MKTQTEQRPPSVAVIGLLLALSSGCGHTQEIKAPDVSPANDARYRQAVVGSWESAYEVKGLEMKVEATTTYREDGSLHCSGEVTMFGDTSPLEFTGTYRIDKGQKCFTVLEETGGIVTDIVGKEQCERIIEISPTEIRAQDLHDGEVTVETRVETTS